jgi:hypothetical protein
MRGRAVPHPKGLGPPEGVVITHISTQQLKIGLGLQMSPVAALSLTPSFRKVLGHPPELGLETLSKGFLPPATPAHDDAQTAHIPH